MTLKIKNQSMFIVSKGYNLGISYNKYNRSLITLYSLLEFY